MTRTTRPLHDLVLAIIDDLVVLKGAAGLSNEKLDAWITKLAKPEVRRETRVFLDCIEASLRLHGARQTTAARQLLLLSGVGLNNGERAARQREGGDAWSRMRPSKFSAVC